MTGCGDGALERGDGTPCLTTAYETVRAWVAGTERPPSRPPGLALLVRYGLPTWMREWPVWAPADRTVTTATTPAPVATPAPSPPVVSSVQAREVAMVRAAMALRSVREDKG